MSECKPLPSSCAPASMDSAAPHSAGPRAALLTMSPTSLVHPAYTVAQGRPQLPAPLVSPQVPAVAHSLVSFVPEPPHPLELSTT